jgi:hypothetical protein
LYRWKLSTELEGRMALFLVYFLCINVGFGAEEWYGEEKKYLRKIHTLACEGFECPSSIEAIDLFQKIQILTEGEEREIYALACRGKDYLPLEASRELFVHIGRLAQLRGNAVRKKELEERELIVHITQADLLARGVQNLTSVYQQLLNGDWLEFRDTWSLLPKPHQEKIARALSRRATAHKIGMQVTDLPSIKDWARRLDSGQGYFTVDTFGELSHVTYRFLSNRSKYVLTFKAVAPSLHNKEA